MNSSGVSTAGFHEIHIENDDRFQSQINVSPNRLNFQRKNSDDNTPAITIEATDYDKSVKVVTSNSPQHAQLTSSQFKPKKRYNMFNKPELTGSVYSKNRKNTGYERDNMGEYDE